MQIKWAYLLTFVLCLLLPLQSFTVHAENLSDLPKDTLVLYTDSDSEIDLYVDSSMEESIVILPTGTKVLFDEQESKTISKVRISMEHITNLEEYDEEVLANNTILVNDVEQLEGYVYSDLIVSSSDIFDQYVSEESEEDMADNQPHEEQSESSVTIEDSKESSQNNTNDITDETIQEQEPVKQVETETQIESETFHTPAMLTVQSVNYKSISRLGHIRNRDVQIFKAPGGKDYIKAGAQYTNAVYYIKREAVVNKDAYYLLSTSPSATRGVVGWAKASDLSTHPHVGVDKTPKLFGIKGNGKATSKAWGGSKDTVHASLSSLKGKTLHVNLTEKVGKNTWYRGKIDGKGSNVWVHSSYVNPAKESNTSRLGHIRNRNVPIFKQLGGPSFTAGSKYTNAVYYIKRQATVGNETYYLLSTSPSATKGVVGWAKASDLSTHPHVGVDKTPKLFGIKGNGKATSKAWGGSKDTVHASLSSLKGKTLHVNLTERVGNNTWYRGKIDGKGSNVWVHSSYVDSAKESSVSRLGHIRNRNVQMFKQLGGPSFTAGNKYTNAVYYIKRQATVGSETFYLLSTSPSATKGVVGWAKASDLSTHPHVGVDKTPKLFGIKGNGKATSKAWGGSKDTVHASLSSLKGKTLHVNLTERVGNNTWYRGKIDGKGSNVWVHSNFVEAARESRTSRLGHIRNRNVQIFKQLGGSSFTAGSKYTNAVYYIKRQATVGSETFYLLSTSPSATKGVVGWAKASDLSTHPHVGVDKVTKKLEINGKGKATTKAWGGSKDTVYANMSAHKGKSFVVNLTEKVGNNIWYRGKINGRGSNIWLHSNQVSKSSAKIIVIDAGHGGSDPGASANGLREKDLTLDISKRVERLLVNAGYTVIMTRTDDSNLTLAQRSKLANDANADLFISIHINAGGGRGIETWWNDKNSNPKESEQLAKDVQNEIIKSTKASDRGVKGRGPNRGNFHVTREPKMPSALVEVGFIDTKSDADKLKDKNFLQRAAEGIANGIKKFFS